MIARMRCEDRPGRSATIREIGRLACRGRCYISLCLVLVLTGSVHGAAFPEAKDSNSYKPYPPIEITSWAFDTPRPMRVWTARIDLTSPQIEFVVTPHGEFADRLETACATTQQFAEAFNVQLAVNATPFSPKRRAAGEGMDVVGLSVSDGDAYSPAHRFYGSLLIKDDGDVDILSPPIPQQIVSNTRNGVGGFHVLIHDGQDRSSLISASMPTEFVDPNPRTAAGLSADEKTLWLIVVDGRQPPRSEGMSVSELAAFGAKLGCRNLLNLDGGGSSTMVLQDPSSKQWRVVNNPVGLGMPGTLRMVGNNLGIRVHEPATMADSRGDSDGDSRE